ncbi:MAG: hypothetical protein GY937_05795 [bacterium]|nr:hypothetical protein [bacterium]
MPETAAPDHDVVYRSCNLCEAHCGIAVTVDRAANRVIDIRGDENDVVSRGYVCPNLNYARKLAENLAFHGFGVPRGD